MNRLTSHIDSKPDGLTGATRTTRYGSAASATVGAGRRRSIRSHCVVWCCATVAVVAFAGCGGASGGSDLSKAQLAAKANAICRSAKASPIAARLRASPTSTSEASALADFDKLLSLGKTMLSQIKALKPDSHTKADVAAFVAVGERQAALGQSGIKKLRASDLNGLKDLAATSALQSQTTARAQRLGWTQCVGAISTLKR